MSTARLTLHGEPTWASPFVFPVFVTLEEKRIPHDLRMVDVEAGDHREPAYRDQALTGRVPAITHGDFWLAESSAVVEYLEDAFPAPDHPAVLPAGLRERGRARQIMSWLRSSLGPLKQARSTETMFFSRPREPLDRSAQQAAHELFSVTERLLRGSADTVFAGFSVVDAEIAFALHRLILSGDPVPERLHRYALGHFSRPSVQRYVTHERHDPRR